MENSPEIPEIMPSLQQLLKGVLDEEYSAFFVCNDEYTAGVVEQAASESEIGRAELLNEVAREAVSHGDGKHVKPFLYGGLTFAKGTQPEMLDVSTNHIGANLTHWYIRLNRPDIAYLYTHESTEPLQHVYPISFRNSIKRS
jgi:hypothetical protein